MQHETLIKKRYGREGLAKQCAHCRHFVYREEKPRNWVCRCPNEKLRFKGNLCLGFEFGEHPEMVVMHSR